MTMEKGMRNKDLRRSAEVILRHRTTKQARPFRSIKEEWSAIRTLDWAYPILIHHGYIGAGEPEEKVACKGVRYKEVG